MKISIDDLESFADGARGVVGAEIRGLVPPKVAPDLESWKWVSGVESKAEEILIVR